MLTRQYSCCDVIVEEPGNEVDVVGFPLDSFTTSIIRFKEGSFIDESVATGGEK